MLASDEIGNLTNDGTWSYSWQHGRQLAQMSRPDASGDTEMIRFRYDSNGRRIGKTYGDSYNFRIAGGRLYYIGDSTGTSYYYAGDDLSQINITFPDNSSTSLHFTYDALGPMSVTYDGAEYFYLKNAQGDVTGLVNSAIRADELEAVSSMLAADPALVNIPAPKKPADTRGMSPLQAALCTGWHRDIAWFLLEHGADGNFCAGADRENRSAYSGKTIRQHYEGSPVWELFG